MTMGEALRAARLRAGLTQVQAAKLARVGQRTWSHYEASANLRRTTLDRIEKRLGWVFACDSGHGPRFILRTSPKR